MHNGDDIDYLTNAVDILETDAAKEVEARTAAD
jgi:hypothetical protein